MKKTLSVIISLVMVFSIIASTDAYTVGTGILFRAWDYWPIVSIPMKNPLDIMRVGWIKSQTTNLSPTARDYIEQLKNTLINRGVTLSESAVPKTIDSAKPDMPSES